MHLRKYHSQDNRIATLERTIGTLEKLLNISRRLNSTLEMRPLLQQIVESAAELTDADGASILLMEDSGTLRFAAASGPESVTLQNTVVPLDKSLAGWVATHREVAVVENAQSDSRMYNINAVNAETAKKWIDLGIQYMVVGYETRMLFQGAKATVSALKKPAGPLP